jgi:hypothetical protein
VIMFDAPSKLARYVVAVLALVLVPAAAEATCVITGATLVTGTTASIGHYTANSTLEKPMTVSVTLTLTRDAGTDTCSGYVAFLRAGAAGRLTGAGGAQLPYGVQNAATSTSVLSSPGWSSSSMPFSFSASAATPITGGYQKTISVDIKSVISGQSPSASGGFSDNAVVVAIYDVADTSQYKAAISNWFVYAAVNAACSINNQTMVTDAVGMTIPVRANGTVNTSASTSKDYSSVSCNAPSDIELSSANGGLLRDNGSVAGLSSLIPYAAQATFAGVTATLNTATSVATKGSMPITATTGATGLMTVTVTTPQQTAQMLAAGRYSDTLTVRLTPQ